MYKLIAPDGQQHGPIDAEQIRRWLAQGRVNRDTSVMAEGTSEWRPLHSFPELMTEPTTYLPQAAEMVNGPAIGLMVTAILGFVGSGLGILFNLIGTVPAIATGNSSEAAMNMFSGTIGLMFNFVAIIVGVVVLIGALKMKKLESHSWAMASSILALIPCVSPCCIVGIPIGIWSLVVLSKPEVKNAFQ